MSTELEIYQTMGNLDGENIVRILYHAFTNEGNLNGLTDHFSSLFEADQGGMFFSEEQYVDHVKIEVLNGLECNDTGPDRFLLRHTNLDMLANIGEGLCGYYVWTEQLNFFRVPIPFKYQRENLSINLNDTPAECREREQFWEAVYVSNQGTTEPSPRLEKCQEMGCACSILLRRV